MEDESRGLLGMGRGLGRGVVEQSAIVDGT